MDQAEALRNLLMENEDGSKNNKTGPSFRFASHKAGMQKVDKEKINAIIADATKNSGFYNKQVEKKERSDHSVVEKKAKIEKFQRDKQETDRVNLIIQKKIEKLEKERDLSRTWVHVDLDMFYAACEIRDNPGLKDKPVAVGDISMINTANYVARQYGVRAAMPGFIAKKLCPELIFIKENSQKYRETSTRFKNIVTDYDPDFESGSSDEALLDLTDYLHEHGLKSVEDIEQFCYDMRMKVNEATGITCSCGIAPNKMLAKLSSEINKPNGQYYMKPVKEDITAFLEKLPVRKIPGIGISSEQVLNGLGINSCKDIVDNLSNLFISFTENTFDFFISAAFGVSQSFHVTKGEQKSVTTTRKFPKIDNQVDMENKIREVAVILGEELQYLKKKAKHFTLTLKTHDFKVRNKGIPIEKYTNDGVEITKVALKIFQELLPVDPLRIIIIRATQLMDCKNLNALDSFFNKTSNKNQTHTQKELQENTHGFADLNSDFNKSLLHLLNEPCQETDPQILTESEKTTFSTIFEPELKQEEESHMIPTPVQQPSNIPSAKPNGIICPICNFKFESSVNNTRINNHIDKCLGGTPTFQLELENEAIQIEPTAPEENKKAKSLNKKRSGHEESNQTTNDLKKTKKSLVETKGIQKLDSFFSRHSK